MLRQALADMPTERETLDALHAEMATLSPDDVPAWTKRAMKRVADAETARTARAKLESVATRARLDSTAELARALPTLAPIFDKAAATLARLAPLLPDNQPLDAEEAAEHGAGGHVIEARTAVETIQAITAIHVTPNATLPSVLLTLCPAIAAPAVPSEVRRPNATAAFNEDTIGATRTVRRIIDDASKHGDFGRLVVDVARGRYGDDVQLRLSDGLNQTHQTAARLEHAGTTHVTRDPGKAAAILATETEYAA
ncbi:hypothetical protein [Agrococcus baldri]|uniref:hypothetical protein n=1 Tax=Agrococcus baldri TaxID=153730 RepID=UPI001160BCB9|nr:hypothetical protein [Agrococcus baldri]